MTILSTLLDVSYGTSTTPSCFCGARREEVCECGEWRKQREWALEMVRPKNEEE